jgi:hypothetical protein
MPTCPKGHTSAATDYCDECGAPIGGAPPAVAPSTVAPAAPSTVAPAAVGPAGDPCPECATPRDGRFCEVCGHDFLAEPGPGAAPSPVSPNTPAEAAPEPVAGPAGPIAGPAGPWRAVVVADRAYYDRMQAQAEPDAEPVAFPLYCPERRFGLTGPEVLIGRRSRSRGIEPAIDLTGPPEDAGVSHAHALLLATAIGWSVVDLDSANGTYVNEATEPIPPHQPVPLTAGDRVHIGAWTTLTVQPA